MNKTKIEWVKNENGSQGYSWNPCVGCKHNCSYCYAKRMNDRFKWISKWNEPRFYPERLDEPSKVRVDSKIFVCSMADLFGDWVPKDWIEKILGVVHQNSQHTFQFLTKNPKRYLEFEFPENCWLGVTLTGEDIFKDIVRDAYMDDIKNNKRFVSIEPLLGHIGKYAKLKKYDMAIIGAMTGPNAIVPKQEWIKSIKHSNIFWKNNIKKYLV